MKIKGTISGTLPLYSQPGGVIHGNFEAEVDLEIDDPQALRFFIPTVTTPPPPPIVPSTVGWPQTTDGQLLNPWPVQLSDSDATGHKG